MSASRPKKSSKPTAGSRSVAGNRRRRDSGRTGWFLLSLALHTLTFLLLVLFTPLRELVPLEKLMPKPAEATMSSDELQELAMVIEIRAAERIQENAQELDRVLEEIHKIENRMNTEFEAFAEVQQNTAADDAIAEMEKAIEHMTQASAAQAENAPLETIDRHQVLAEQAQERARVKLAMVPFPVKKAIDEHTKASTVHQEAKQTQETVRQAKVELPRREATRDAREEELKQATAALEEKKKAETPEKDMASAQKRVASAATAAEKARTEATALAQKLAQAQRDARARQDSTIPVQERAMDALKQAAAKQQQKPAMAAQTQPRDIPKPEKWEPVDPGDRIDVPELYDHARATEDSVAEAFKEVRAMDLAMVRDIKLEEAREDIDVVRPVRPDLDAELLQEAVRTDARFEKHKEELKVALRESVSMVSLAHRMLEMANESVEGMTFATEGAMVEEMAAETDFQLLIEELAMEDVSGRFSDMAGVMLQAEAAEEGEGEQGAKTSAARIDFEDLTEEEPEGAAPLVIPMDGDEEGLMAGLTPDVEAVGARRISEFGEPTQWMYVDSWYTLGPFPNPNRVNIDREFPPDSIIDLDASYIGKDGRTVRWMFAQTSDPELVPPNAEEYGIWYAYTELHFDEPRDMLIALGTDDRGILKINGVPVWISSKRLKGWDIDEVWRRVHFRQGMNRILYRVENGWMHVGFSMVLRMPDA